LAKKGFGLWYDDVLQMPPADFDTTLALRIIGYDVRNLKPITAFKRHFVGTDLTPKLTEPDKLILFNLYKKYL
jgi:N-acetylmuramoyl-L-alanine amidase